MDSPKEILDFAYNMGGIMLPFKVIETGCASTRGIAKWFYNLHLDCYDRAKRSKSPVWSEDAKYMTQAFDNFDLDGRLQESTHHQLEVDGTAPWCTFRTQDPLKGLADSAYRKVIFLNPPDLQNGLEQFKMAASTGTPVIVMHDYQAKAAFAIRESRRLGWDLWESGRYFTLLRK